MTPRKPAAFRLSPQSKAKESQKIKKPESKPHKTKATARERAPVITFTPLPEEDAARHITAAPIKGLSKKRMRWGVIFVSALTSLLTLGLGLYAAQTLANLFTAHPWLGWAASVLLFLAGIAAVGLAGREVIALLRQRRIGRIRAKANTAMREASADAASAVQGALIRLYSPREDLAWGLARIGEHDEDILDAEARLHLLERELMQPLDRQARSLIASTAKRISILTAISPSAIVDIAFVAALNLRLLRGVSTFYGGRPGALGMLRLARMVLTHLVVTGGIALGEDVLNQVLGHSLMSKISSRLGEGALNGALSARIGLAAMEICRPLPFNALKSPKLKGLLSEVLKSSKIAPPS